MKFIFFVILISCFFTGCRNKIEMYVYDNLAEIRHFVMADISNDCKASIMCGKREVDYKYDGFATELTPFGVITIMFDDSDEMSMENASYVLFVGTKKYSGQLIQNPFDKSLVADIGEIIDKSQNVKLDIVLNGKEFSFKLVDLTLDWSVTSEDCIGVLVDKYQNELLEFVKNGEFCGEVYIKITDNNIMNTCDYYFYVSVIGRSGNSINMIISTLTGDILTSNCNIIV